MPTRLRVFYSLLTGALLFIPVVALYSELAKRSDIWWTPPPSALSLTESEDRVRIFAEGRPLATLVEQKQLTIGYQLGAGERPTEFASAKGEQILIVNYKRVH